MADEQGITIDSSSLITPGPGIVLQEEADNWGILYNPKTDFSFGINPVSVFIWRQLVNKPSLKELVAKVNENCTDVPSGVETHVEKFIKALLTKKLVTLENS